MPKSPDTDMSPYGFKKELIWQEIEDIGDLWYSTEYLFSSVGFSCDTCKTSDYIWFFPQWTGVFVMCMGCATVNGPVTVEKARKLSEAKIMEPKDVLAIFEARGHRRIPNKLVRQVRQGKTKAQLPIGKIPKY